MLYLDNTFTFGGAIRSLSELLSRLPDHGVRPVVVSGQPAEVLADLFPDATTVPIDVRVPWVHGRPVRGGGFASKLETTRWLLRETWPAARRFTRLGQRYGVDLVHINNALQSVLDGILASWRLGVPCVVHSRGIPRYTRSVGASQRLVAHHIAISEGIKDNLVDIGVPDRKITVIHNGLDASEFGRRAASPLRRDELGLTEEDWVFGLFGRIIPWKGTLEFVRAAHRVMSEHPQAVAVIVGDSSDGEEAYFQEVRTLIDDGPFGSRFRLTGYRSDVPELMGMMDAVVHCSLDPEPFGRVIVEGMAAGKPVVAADGPGPRDIIRSGSNGLMTSRGDVAALADAILQLIKDPELSHRIAQKGASDACERFDISAIARRTADVYRGMLAE